MAFPLILAFGFLGLEALLLPNFWQERIPGAFWRGIARFDRHKILKSRPMGLSKATLRWYIPLAPKGICPGCLLRKPPDGIDRRPWALASIRFGFGFSKARNGLSRGGAAR
jgi:hypothetical protein